jgi:hypothetical protein
VVLINAGILLQNTPNRHPFTGLRFTKKNERIKFRNGQLFEKEKKIDKTGDHRL